MSAQTKEAQERSKTDRIEKRVELRAPAPPQMMRAPFNP